MFLTIFNKVLSFMTQILRKFTFHESPHRNQLGSYLSITLQFLDKQLSVNEILFVCRQNSTAAE
jgi:hypothetical protein